jgi:hypothetical protein
MERKVTHVRKDILPKTQNKVTVLWDVTLHNMGDGSQTTGLHPKGLQY